jgi:hypothetical protein
MFTAKYKQQSVNSMETHEVYLQMFDMCSISYSLDINMIFEFFPCMLQLWLVNADYGLWNSFLKGL